MDVPHEWALLNAFFLSLSPGYVYQFGFFIALESRKIVKWVANNDREKFIN